MSADNPAAATTTRRSMRTQRTDSASSSSHAATPAVLPTLSVMESLQESSTVMESHSIMHKEIFGDTDSELSDLSDFDDNAEDKASASPIPREPSPRQPSPKAPAKARKINRREFSEELPASSSGSTFEKRRKIVHSDPENDPGEASKAVKDERNVKAPRKRPLPKAADQGGSAGQKSTRERDGTRPKTSQAVRNAQKGDNSRTKEEGNKKVVVTYHPDEDHKRVATEKVDKESKPPRISIKLNVSRSRTQHSPDESEPIGAESSTNTTRPRSAQSSQSNHQQERQQLSRKVSDSRDEFGDTSRVPGGREGEAKMGKRPRPRTEDEGEYEQPRSEERSRDRYRDHGEQSRKVQKKGRFENRERRESYSDADVKPTKQPKTVRLDPNITDSKQRTTVERASLSANKIKSDASQRDWFETPQGSGGKTPHEGGGKTPHEAGGKTPHERGGKTPKTSYASEPERTDDRDRVGEEGRIKKKSKRKEDRQREMEVDMEDDENVTATAEAKPAKQKLTSDNSMDSLRVHSRTNKSRKAHPQEEDENSDSDRDDKRDIKPSQAKKEKLEQLKRKKARSTHPDDSILDASSDIEVNLGSQHLDIKKRTSDKSSLVKQEDNDVDMIDDIERAIKPKLQKRPGGRVAELAGVGMGSRTPGEGKAKTGDGAAAGGSQSRRPGLQPAAAKKSHYDPLGSALSSLPGIGPGLSSGVSRIFRCCFIG